MTNHTSTVFASESEAATRALRRVAFAAERARLAQHTIPNLIDLLSSADLRTRFIAEMCLRDATDT
ncbi:MAG: hypothetical protein H0W76_25520 [Pyrinomonadaceae bacterium]|nr:hypothetical protein [Pyrinomonadaceae bacterium]